MIKIIEELKDTGTEQEIEESQTKPSNLRMAGGIYSMLDEINEIQEDRSKPNWDGEGAKPISQNTASSARKFILALCDSPIPHISPDPDGYISFEWRNNKNMLVVEIDEKKLRYAYITGDSEMAEINLIDNKRVSFIPSRVKKLIEELSSLTH